MHPITFTVSLAGQSQPLTVNLTDLLVCFQTVPDQRKRRGVRYPLAVLLTIAVLAKLSGQSQVHALADWASARAVELAAVFGLSRARMPHPTTWTRILGYGVTADAVEAALHTLLSAPTAEVPPRASCQARRILSPDSRVGLSPDPRCTRSLTVSILSVPLRPPFRHLVRVSPVRRARPAASL